ncbi:hypothetical protein GF378_00425 [Candidatus Pacearchaeota archaeon]|nr:hypothetical protein [Candidatus Pacearchaeota archaeon]
MNKNKILELVEKDFKTLMNLERSIKFALNSTKGRQYQYKVCHAAFKRTYDIMLRRREQIAKIIGMKLKSSKKEQNHKITYNLKNPKHRIILRLLYELKLKPKQIVNLKVKDYTFVNKIVPSSYTRNKQKDDFLIKSNRNKKYSLRTIHKIKEKNIKKSKI